MRSDRYNIRVSFTGASILSTALHGSRHINYEERINGCSRRGLVLAVQVEEPTSQQEGHCIGSHKRSFFHNSGQGNPHEWHLGYLGTLMVLPVGAEI
jgi:hypothetical protein